MSGVYSRFGRRLYERWTPLEDSVILNPPADCRHPEGTKHAGEPNYRVLGARLQRSAQAVASRLRVLNGSR